MKYSEKQYTGTDIRVMREAVRMSLGEFAKVLGVATTTVSRWEAKADGRSFVVGVQVELLAALASVLHRHREQPAQLEKFINELQTSVKLNDTLQAMHCLLCHFWDEPIMFSGSQLNGRQVVFVRRRP